MYLQGRLSGRIQGPDQAKGSADHLITGENSEFLSRGVSAFQLAACVLLSLLLSKARSDYERANRILTWKVAHPARSYRNMARWQALLQRTLSPGLLAGH